jgi:hypothetical protein
MLSSVNFWMCFAGLIYLVAGVFILRKRSARLAALVAATIEMDDFTWAHRHSDCCDLFCRRIFSSSRVCARLSFGKDHAIVGSIPQRMGISHSSDPTGRWNRLGPDQKISDGRNLDWRTK